MAGYQCVVATNGMDRYQRKQRAKITEKTRYCVNRHTNCYLFTSEAQERSQIVFTTDQFNAWRANFRITHDEKHMNENMMKEIIGKYPSEALDEEGVVFFGSNVKTGNGLVEIALKDSRGRLILLDVHKGPLDSGKIEQHIERCNGFLKSNPYFHIRIMYVANYISTLQKDFLHRVGCEFRELYQKKLDEIAEKHELLHKDLPLLNIEEQSIKGHSEKKDAIRILILEDDPTSGKLLTNFLTPHGDCDLVTDGKSAVEFFQKAIRVHDGYKLIFVDIMVPETLGHDVVRLIREVERKEGISLEKKAKVIVTSALSDPDNIIEAFKADCDSYLIKPIRKAKLINEIKSLGISIDSENNDQ